MVPFDGCVDADGPEPESQGSSGTLQTLFRGQRLIELG